MSENIAMLFIKTCVYMYSVGKREIILRKELLTKIGSGWPFHSLHLIWSCAKNLEELMTAEQQLKEAINSFLAVVKNTKYICEEPYITLCTRFQFNWLCLRLVLLYFTFM